MIIYKNTIQGFINDCKQGMIACKVSLSLNQKKGINVSGSELNSWHTTLRNMADYFSSLENKESQYILLEFLIPIKRKRIDLIIVGKDKNAKQNFAIMELKGWSKINLVNNSNLLNPHVSYGLQLHPAIEAADYNFLIKNHYSIVADKFSIFTIAFLPNYKYKDVNVLKDSKYKDILKQVDLYSKNEKSNFISFLQNNFNSPINENEVDFLNTLKYSPSKDFVKHLEEDFENIELIGSQKKSFEIIKSRINSINKKGKRTIILISGIAGSGKSIVAFKTLAYILKNKMIAKLILPGVEFRNAIKKLKKKGNFTKYIKGATYTEEFDFAIVDEAHKCLGGISGNSKAFFEKLLPTIKNGIFLIDDFQVVNKKGISKSALEKVARENKFSVIDVNLEEQFRNNGDATFIQWLQNWIYNEKNGQVNFIDDGYQFKILDHKDFNIKYDTLYEEYETRMTSFWTQTWELQKVDRKNKRPYATVKIGNKVYIWNPNDRWFKKIKVQNVYQTLSQDTQKQLHYLCNELNFNIDKKGKDYIAYFNTIQGFEFDYIFVHVPKLFFLNKYNKIDVNLNYLDLSEMHSQIWMKNKKPNQTMAILNKSYFLNRLFVNLTRGKKGTYVYIEDEKLKEWLNEKLKKPIYIFSKSNGLEY